MQLSNPKLVDAEAEESSAAVGEQTLRRSFVEREIWGWPLYAILLAVGQMLCASSFQLTLLSGTSLQDTNDIYILASTLVAATFAWHILLGRLSSYVVLSLAFTLFGIAFFLIGLPALSSALQVYSIHRAITLTASMIYATASAASFFLFSLNFGAEAGVSPEAPIARAWLIQGLSTLWTSALWYFGFQLAFRPLSSYWSPTWLFGVTLSLAVGCFAAAIVLYRGLPAFYRTVPPRISRFWITLFRRKIIVWFLIAECARNFWLSAPYGRNWQFLWQSGLTPAAGTIILLLVFFIGVWSLLMWLLWRASRTNSWTICIFAMGLGSPRWAQMLWALSGIGLYIPWLSPSAFRALDGYFSISLWLWLGVLDAIQGIGYGVILLQTLSRQHVGAALALAQVSGAVVVMVANRIWPLLHGQVFPNFAFLSTDSPIGSAAAQWPLWTCLSTQLLTPVGFFVFYRDELLSRP